MVNAIKDIFANLFYKTIAVDKLRERWIIIITEQIPKDVIKFLMTKDVKEYLFDNDKHTNLAFIITDSRERHKKFQTKMDFNKSVMLNVDNINILRKKMGIIGNIDFDKNFVNERFEKYDDNARKFKNK